MENVEQIELYLDQEMSVDEREVFEQELATNPRLQQQVKEVRAARAAIEILYTDSIRQRLQGYEEQYVKKQKKRNRYWLGGILILALLAAGIAWGLLSGPSQQEIYARHSEQSCEEFTSILSPETKSQGPVRTQPLPKREQEIVDICAALRQQDSLALNQYRIQLEGRMTDLEAKQNNSYLLAMIYAGLGQYQAADAHLQWVATDPQAFMHEEAQSLIKELDP